MDWQEYILTDPDVCHGLPCLKGTRIPVSNILAEFSVTLNAEKISKSYPGVTHTQIKACIYFASELTRFNIMRMVEK